MLKKVITYTNYDEEEVTKTLYFNLTQSEAVGIALDLPDDVSETVKGDEAMDLEQASSKLVEKLGNKGVFEFIKQLVLKSYGVRIDGDRFNKSDKIREEFEQSLAFDAILMELMQDDIAAANFVNGVLPAKLAEKVKLNNVGGNLIAPVTPNK